MGIVYAFLSALMLTVQAASIPYTEIKQAFERNDVEKVTNLAKPKLMIGVLGKEEVLSKSQAKHVLSDFFQKHPCKSFDFIFKGKESSDGTFAIGTYVSSDEEFRVTLLLNLVNNQYRIETLTIERDGM